MTSSGSPTSIAFDDLRSTDPTQPLQPNQHGQPPRHHGGLVSSSSFGLSPSFGSFLGGPTGHRGHGVCGTLDILIPFLIVLDFGLWVLFMYELSHTTCLSMPARTDTNYDILIGVGYVAAVLEVAYGINHAGLWHITSRLAAVVQIFCLTWGITNLTIIVLFILWAFEGDFLLGVIVGVKMTILSIHLIEVVSTFLNRRTKNLHMGRKCCGNGQFLMLASFFMVLLLAVSLRAYDDHGYVQQFVAVGENLLAIDRKKDGATFRYPQFNIDLKYSLIFSVLKREELLTFSVVEPETELCSESTSLSAIYRQPSQTLCGRTINLAFESCNLADTLYGYPPAFAMSPFMKILVATVTELLVWKVLAATMVLTKCERRGLHALWSLLIIITIGVGAALWRDE